MGKLGIWQGANFEGFQELSPMFAAPTTGAVIESSFWYGD
jgi:hypothetical protein